jgi:hypothetical protein
LNTTFTPNDTANYTTASASVLINVIPATPIITWSNPANITYGTPLSSTQLDATSSVPGTFVYNPPFGTVLGAGSHQTLGTTFTPNDTANYSTASATALINVEKATPIITWSNPADITYGTPLSSTQLNATYSVPGNFIYTPSSGTVLSVGPQMLNVLFIPTDLVDYNITSAAALINVTQATPTLTWGNPANIVYGTKLNSTQLNATSSVPGNFIYTPSPGTVLSISPQMLNVLFIPTDLVDYNIATASVSINVTQ